MLQAVRCDRCGIDFERPKRRCNEAVKFGWKQYCSMTCHALEKTTSVLLICSRCGCGRKFLRKKSQLLSHGKTYCSSRCFALVSNKEHPRWMSKIKTCAFCGKDFRRNKKYCSPECQSKSQILGKDFIMAEIKTFVRVNGRIPLKREFGHCSAARRAFGTWNNTIKAAGFEPNPVLFAKKYIANDGHKCDSLSERIIDDWLFRRKIKHERNFTYPSWDGFTVDFKVNDYWIEFFGLCGGLKRYDWLMKRKLALARKLKIKLIKIYPKDLFPVGHIEEKLNFLI